MTGKQLVNPLAGLIKSAAKSLPATTGETAKFEARLNDNSGAVVILADVSGSMSEFAGASRKIQILQDALAVTMPMLPGARLWAFSAVAREVTPETLPNPSGGTALDRAFDAVSALRPAKTVVISDGQPNDAAAALVAAKGVTGVIDVIYCGPDGDMEAIAFMRALAKQGLGTVVVRPLNVGATAISQEIQRLALPAR